MDKKEERQHLILLSNIGVGLLLFLVFTIGCGVHSGPSPHSGFLTDYSKLELAQGEPLVFSSHERTVDQFDRVVVNEGSYLRQQPVRSKAELLVFVPAREEIKQFKKVIIDPVVFDSHLGGDTGSLSMKERNKLSRELHSSLVRALQVNYDITTTPGKGVLQIRTAITNIHENSPVLSLFLNAAAEQAAVAVGGACVEIEGLNSETQEQVFAIVERKKAKKVGLQAGFKKWEHTNQAFRHWASLVKEILDRGRGLPVFGGHL